MVAVRCLVFVVVCLMAVVSFCLSLCVVGGVLVAVVRCCLLLSVVVGCRLLFGAC